MENLVKVIFMLVLLTGCGTTSVMKCDRYVGPEKEECIKNVRQKQERLSDVHERFDRR